MTYSLTLFNLEGIRPVMHKQAKAAARRGDPLGIFGCEDSNMSLYLLSKNVRWFSWNGLYEKALLQAWVNQKWVPSDFYQPMKDALLSADRKKLMQHSDPLPPSDPLTVYRGVQKGVPRGISWTLDPAVAQRFASWWGQPGTVYRTKVRRSDVYAYINESGREGEKEVLLVLPDDHPIEVFEEIEGKKSA